MSNFCRLVGDVLSSDNKDSSEESSDTNSENDLNQDEMSLKESNNNEDENVSPTHFLGPSGGPLSRATLPANAYILSDQVVAAMTSFWQ